MARPLKQGLDYFPIVTDWDQKMKLIRARFGLFGVGTIVAIFQEIYAEGYAKKWDEDAQLLFSSTNGTTIQAVKEVLDFAILKDIFSQKIYEKSETLTSHGIQTHWLFVVKESKRVRSEIDPNLCLLDETEFPREETPPTPSFPGRKPRPEGVSPGGNAHIILNEIKGNKSLAALSGAPVDNSQEPKSQEPEPDVQFLTFALKIAAERKARNPEAMARKLMAEPDIRAQYLAAQATPEPPPKTQLPPNAPDCECGGTVKTQRTTGEAICQTCKRTWTWNPVWLEWVPDSEEEFANSG